MSDVKLICFLRSDPTLVNTTVVVVCTSTQLRHINISSQSSIMELDVPAITLRLARELMGEMKT